MKGLYSLHGCGLCRKQKHIDLSRGGRENFVVGRLSIFYF